MTSHRVRRWTGVLLVSGLLLAGACEVWSASPAKLPADLELVPRQAAAFVAVRAADLWSNELFRDVRHLVQRAGPEALKDFEKRCTPRPANIDRLALVFLTPQALANPFPTVDPEALSVLCVVTTLKPYDRLEVIGALGFREKVYRRNLYYFNEELWSGLLLIDERTFVIGSEDALVQFLELSRTPDAGGPLQDALQAAARKHPVVVGVNPQAFAKERDLQMLPPPLKPLLDARCGVLTVDLDQDMSFDLRLHYAGEAEAREGEKAMRAALELAIQGLGFPIQELEGILKKEKTDASNLPEGVAALLGLGMLRELEARLKEAPVKQQGAIVGLPIKFRNTVVNNTLGTALMAISALGTNASGRFSTVADRVGDKKNPHEEHLRVLAQGLEKYHEDKGSYPPAALYDAEGRPLLSWRVALLPYLGEEPLYREFRLDEPWDSLHNKKLIKKLPKAFKAPNTWTRGKTHDKIFTGANTIFDGPKGVRKADVAGKTILLALVNNDNPVYWTKPADLEYADDQPLPGLFGEHRDICHVLLADGTYQALRKETDEKLLRSLIKRNAPKDKLPE